MKRTEGFLLVAFLLTAAGCTKEAKTFTTVFSGKLAETAWAVEDLNPALPADWSSSGFLTFEMRSTTTQRFDLRLIDSAGARRVTIQPFQGPWVRASIPLVHFQQRNTKGMDLAAIGKTARPGYWIGFSSQVGPITNVDSIKVSMRLPIGNPTLEIRNVILTAEPMDTVFGPYPLVDEFGQWIPAEWPGKAKTEEDLRNAWDAEDKALAPGSFGLSEYGGFAGSKTKASGFFRVEKINDAWWFVDPSGHLFYSVGTTGIGPRSEFSRVKGREYIYTAFPPSEKIVIPGQQGGQQGTQQNRQGNQQGTQQNRQAAPVSYSFYAWNLLRRFGDDWYEKWTEFTFRRMDDWGLNTIANWSDTNLGNRKRKAYVATLRGWGIETGLMGMPDVYDPAWAKSVDEAAERQCAPKKDDPWLLGYFIGNEPPWPHRETELVNLILNGDASPMQAELKKYLGEGDSPERRIAFVYATYEKFISTINAAIKKHDPNHLNLGLRFGGSAPDEIIRASKGFDVFSFNHYGYSLNPDMLKRIYDITGLPMVIGEFHFGVPERGLAPGLAQTLNQEERGVAYRYYVENAAAHPAVIGTHWFQWMDQPATGRNDGENYNIGFVDVTDRPYTELINAAKETFSRIHDIHSGKIQPVTREALRQ